MSIGDTLAEARRRAGITITQVSQQTRIRETIIRGIERGDYSACGGDFYARGHIRSIARAVGTDPEPLIREYDVTQGAPHQVTAADVFEPSAPIRITQRRRPNWSAVMALALLVIVGLVTWRVVEHPAAGPRTAARHQLRPKVAPSSADRVSRQLQGHHGTVVIRLTAVSNCWVQLNTSRGHTIFSGIVYAGTAKRWIERHAVNLRIGDPAAVRLKINGRKTSPGPPGQPVTLSFGPSRQAAG